MTQNGTFKRRVRQRAAKTGESYTAALRYLRAPSPDEGTPGTRFVRLAVAQVTHREDPRDGAALRANGAEIRHLMHEAHRAGARLVHFPEGATCAPGKRLMSRDGPDEIAPADWNRVDWDVLREEREAVRALAGELRLWTVLGSVHPLTPPNRPHNSLYVLSDRGEVATRYDERMLSNTKHSFMYAPGHRPVTFEVDGIRFGCSVGMEVHFPELFAAYEALDVDCVLFSTTGGNAANDAAFAAEALGLAAMNRFWISFAMLAGPGRVASSAIASPTGEWSARCPGDGQPSIAFADITDHHRSAGARMWRRTARSGIYDGHRVEGDARSDDSGSF